MTKNDDFRRLFEDLKHYTHLMRSKSETAIAAPTDLVSAPSRHSPALRCASALVFG